MKRNIAACREHMAKLEARRVRMSNISQDEQCRRDDLLQAAQAQVKLERTVDKKVAKKRWRVSAG